MAYDLFYDFKNVVDLPSGFEFGHPPATSGAMFPASLGLVHQTSEAAVGDLALSEFQFSPIVLESGDSQLLHTIHLLIEGSSVASSELYPHSRSKPPWRWL